MIVARRPPTGTIAATGTSARAMPTLRTVTAIPATGTTATGIPTYRDREGYDQRAPVDERAPRDERDDRDEPRAVEGPRMNPTVSGTRADSRAPDTQPR